MRSGVESGSTESPDLAELRAAYLTKLLEGDRRAALTLIVEQGARRGVPIEDLRYEVVQEAQREIGRLWQENVINIAEEHQATAISQIILTHLYDLAPHVGENGKRVMVACVEGELHDLPARLVADALDLAGFRTQYLGANVPTQSLLQRVQVESPDLVALSVTMAFNLPALRQLVPRLRELSDVPIVVGGGGCAGQDVRDLSCVTLAQSTRELVPHVKQLLGVTE